MNYMSRLEIVGITTCGTYPSWLDFTIASFYNHVNKIVVVNAGYIINKYEDGAIYPLEREHNIIRRIDIHNKILEITPNTFNELCKQGKDEFGRATNITLATNTAYNIPNPENKQRWILKLDSITGDRFIPIINEKGILEVIKMEDLFNRYKEYIQIRDDKEVIEIDKKIKTLTIDKDQFEKTDKILGKWEYINHIIRHKTDKMIYKLNDKYGETEVTEDHSIMILKEIGLERYLFDDYNSRNSNSVIAKNLKLEPCTPKVLNKQNNLVRVGNINYSSNYTEIDLVKYINTKDIFYYNDEFIWSRSKYNKMDKQTIDKIIYLHNIGKSIPYISNLTGAKESTIKYYINNIYERNYVLIKRFYKASELKSLCRICGAYISEGSIQNWKGMPIHLSIANNNIDYLDQIKKDLELITDAEFYYIKDDRERNESTYHLRNNNKEMCTFMSELCGEKAEHKKIPEFIYDLSKEYQKEFLVSYLKGDGHLVIGDDFNEAFDYKGNKSGDESKFNLTSKSLQLVSGFSILFSQLNIGYTINYNEPKEAYSMFQTFEYKKTNSKGLKIKDFYIEDLYVYDIEVENSHMFVDGCGLILLHNSDQILYPISRQQLENLIQQHPNKNGFRFAQHGDYYHNFEHISEGLPDEFTNDGSLFYISKPNQHYVAQGSPVINTSQHPITSIVTSHMRRINPPDVEPYEYHFKRFWYHTLGPNSIMEHDYNRRTGKRLTNEQIIEMAHKETISILRSKGREISSIEEYDERIPYEQPLVCKIGPLEYIKRGH